MRISALRPVALAGAAALLALAACSAEQPREVAAPTSTTTTTLDLWNIDVQYVLGPKDLAQAVATADVVLLGEVSSIGAVNVRGSGLGSARYVTVAPTEIVRGEVPVDRTSMLQSLDDYAAMAVEQGAPGNLDEVRADLESGDAPVVIWNGDVQAGDGPPDGWIPSDQPWLVVGDRVLLFLTAPPETGFGFTFGPAGRGTTYKLDRDRSAAVAIVDAGEERTDIGAELMGRTHDELLAELRTLAQQADAGEIEPYVAPEE